MSWFASSVTNSAIVRSVLALVAISCSSSSGTTSSSAQTLVSIDPSDLPGPALCGDYPGAWRTYVATLVDVTDPTHVVLPSSGPVACHRKVTFGTVAGRRYRAEIDAYDTAELRASGPGSRTMLTVPNGTALEPTWTSACNHPSTSYLASDVTIKGCKEFSRRTTPTPSTGLTIPLHQLLTGRCGTSEESVQRVVVTETASGEAQQFGCDEQQALFANLTANKSYDFHIEAHEAQTDVVKWATRCHGRAIEGVTLPTTCDPLTSLGALQIPLAPLLDDQGLVCEPGGIQTVRAAVLGGLKPASLFSCDADVVLGSLPSRHHQVVVDLLTSDNKVLATGICEATVLPATQQIATCQFSSTNK